MIKVAVAHRYLMERQCLEFRLGQESDFLVVGGTDRVEEVPMLLKESSADVLLLDLGLAGDQLETLLGLSRGRPKTCILSEEFNEEQRKRCSRCGAQHLIAESDGIAALVEMIRKLAASAA